MTLYLLSIFLVALLLCCRFSDARRHELLMPFHISNSRTVASKSASDSIPTDPYFTNGVQQVYMEGELLFEDKFGYMSRLYDVEMSIDSRFRVGSNTKLFTAVSIYQLHERGVLNVSDNVANYLDGDDFDAFGFPGQTTWCPTIKDGDGSCEVITFELLMSMNSRMVDSINCNYAPGSWELEYCQDPSKFQAYPGSIANMVNYFINLPLSAAPGSGFHYTNENFILLSYLIEKLSGLSLREYYQTNIFEVVGLENTYYDALDGTLGSFDAMVGEEYRDYHDMSQTSDVSDSYYTSGYCDEFNPGCFSGTGGMVSNAADMYKWFKNLFLDYNSAILSRESIDALIAPWTLTSSTDTYESYFGQGIGTDVMIGADEPFVIYYTGGMHCATTSIRLLTATDTDPALVAIAFRNNIVVNATKAELSESLTRKTGRFDEMAYDVYQWDIYGDTRDIVAELGDFFRANPTATSSTEKDDDDSDGLSTGATAAIAVVSALVALLLIGLLFYFVKRDSTEMEGNAAGSSRQTSGTNTTNSPMAPPVGDGDSGRTSRDIQLSSA